MQQPWYATREQVKRALDSAETARNNAQVDRAIASASRSIDSQMHRRFYPFDGTRYFGFRPWNDGSSSWRMWLGENDLVSVSTLTAGGTTISASDYFLEPVNSGPPYTSLEIDLDSSSVLQAGLTWQRAIAITGTFGYWDEQGAVGTLSDTLAADATDSASILWTDPALVGVGSILKIDSERLIVTEISVVDSGQLTEAALTASAADNTVSVADGLGFYVGEILQVGSERLLVVEISDNDLTVKRAWDGSVLAAHSAGSAIYGRTGVSLARAQLGSTLAAHTTSDVVYRYVVPSLINDLCIAEAIAQMQGEVSGYSQDANRSVTRPAVAGLRALREEAQAAFGRNARTYAV